MSRPHLLLLHGALGSGAQFEFLVPHLSDRFTVHPMDFEGHGTLSFRDRPFRMEYFAQNVIDYLNTMDIPEAGIFGHSMGGHVGLFVARFFPDRVTKVFTLGTKFAWTPESARKENEMLIPEKIIEKVPQFAAQLKARHSAVEWTELLARLREMQIHNGDHNALPDEDIKRISRKVRISVGDRDKMVGLEESIRIYRLLTDGEFQVFPETPHPLEKAPVNRLAFSIREFF